MLELNAVDEFREVEKETRCHVLLVGRWVKLKKSSEVEAANGPACKHEYLGPYGGKSCPNILQYHIL